MNKLSHFFQKHNKGMRITAAVMIGCMLAADASLYLTLTSDNLPYGMSAGSNDSTTGVSADTTHEIVENHPLEIAMADGVFSGERSKSEQITYGTVSSGAGGKAINIYEIVPEYGNAYFGYLIGGCEPIYPPVNAFDESAVAESKAKAVEYMDALCNRNPGSNNNRPYNFDLQIDNEGVRHFGFYKDKEVEGYYERVSNGTGLYSYINATENSGKITNVEMKSKATGESLNYNYEWHYGSPDPSKRIITKKSDIGSMKVGEVIYLSNYKKNVYGNNESFLTLFFSEGKSSADSPSSVKILNANVNGGVKYVDGNNGVYGIQNNSQERHIYSEYSNNKAVVDAWKQSHNINVFVRTPEHLSDKDIDNADLLLFNPGGKSSVVNMYNVMNGTSHSTKSFGGGSSDLTFEQVVKIYDHVVNKQDLSIAMCKANFGTLKGNNLNIGKLQWMLYSLTNTTEWKWGSAREFFNDVLVDLNPTSSLSSNVKMYEDRVEYYNGSWQTQYNWWQISDYWNQFRKYFLLGDSPYDSTDSYDINLVNDPQKGQYKNMIIFENDTQLTMSNYSGSLFKDMLMSHVEANHTTTANELYYLSMDIMNGDSKSSVSGAVAGAGNKVLYVNEYELPPTTPKPGIKYTEEIPVHICIHSSHDIKSVEVYKDATVNPEKQAVKTGVTKTLKSCNSSSELSGLLPLKEDSVKKTVDDGGTPAEITVTKYEDVSRDSDGNVIDDSITIKIPASELKNASGSYRQNTSIVVNVTNSAGKSAADSINIVYRSFFYLN